MADLYKNFQLYSNITGCVLDNNTKSQNIKSQSIPIRNKCQTCD